MDIFAKGQFIQRAENVHINITLANTDYTVYTAPSGDDFNFSVIMGIFACDHGNQQTNLDISIVDTNTTEFFLFKNHNISAYGTEELIINSGIILQDGETIKAQVNHSNIDIFINIVEYARGD